MPEDELILPPYLSRVETTGIHGENRMNVKGRNENSHQALVGEWLDIGDELRMPGRLSAQVILKENVAWVAGGDFAGKLRKSAYLKNQLVYETQMTKGSLHVWIKELKDEKTELKISTPAGDLVTSDSEFWVMVHSQLTEIYLVSGEIAVGSKQFPLKDRTYAQFQADDPKARYLAKDWDMKAMEVKIAGVYPSFIKLSDQTTQAWQSGKIEEIYAEARKKGWRKAARLDPISK